MTQPIDFYFDFSSPYGYLATARIDDIAAKHGRTVSWRPILLGIAFQKTGQTPLINQPVRGAYFKHDIDRMARDYGIPLVWPENFPFHSVAASRAFYWLADRDSALAVRFARLVFQTYWGEGRDVAKPPQLAEATCEALGLDADDMLAALADGTIKDRLRTEVDQALDKGIFGSPLFDIDGELFWGCDKFSEIDRWLATGGW